MIREFRQQDPGSAGPVAPVEKKRVMSPGAQLTVFPLHLSTGNATHSGQVFLPQGMLLTVGGSSYLREERKKKREERKRERLVMMAL